MPATEPGAAGPAPRPNIILINCDDLGYGDLGCYGSTRNRTPVIDRLAAEGIRFTDFYMASPVCSPSRGAMLTGCYPRRIGFDSFDGELVLFPGMAVGLNPNEHTMGSLLRGLGYATMAIGKWHCGDQPGFLPTDHGFDGFFGLPYSNDMGRQAGADRDFPPLPLMLDDHVLAEQPDLAALTERYTHEAVRFLRDHRDQPFFLYLAHMYVHKPIYPPARFLRESQNGRYGAAVECVDWSTGALVHELEELGLAGNTLIVFTSDNGSLGHDGGSNSPLRGAKGTTWEGGQRLPAIMYWPGRIPAGQVRPQLATSLDLLPTFVALAGGQPPRDRVIDGRDISNLLDDPSAQSGHEAFCYYNRDALEAIRVGEWKLHFGKGSEQVAELYDVAADPGETWNRYTDRPDVVAELEQVAQRYREDLGDARHGLAGTGCRPIGRVADPQPLTRYDPGHPYIEAMYDLPDRG